MIQLMPARRRGLPREIVIAALAGLILGAAAPLLWRALYHPLPPQMTKAPPEAVRALQEGYGFSQGYP
jgi:hypothetical protein